MRQNDVQIELEKGMVFVYKGSPGFDSHRSRFSAFIRGGNKQVDQRVGSGVYHNKKRTA